MGFIKEIVDQSTLIEYMSGANNYTWLYFMDGREQLISKSLSYFEKQLPHFIRVHKTALVNPQYIQEWQAPLRRRMAGTVRMSSEVVLPVGRRRWTEVAHTAVTIKLEKIEQVENKRSRSVFYQSEDDTKGSLLQQTIENQWPDCKVHRLNAGVRLPELLGLLPDHELPTLILLDARKSVMSLLTTLQLLKGNARTASIPTLLLVSQKAKSEVEKGYEGKANSVVVLPEQNTAFIHTINQLAHYWLTVMRLPAAN
ncbi:response regulator transcription factor [Spirosoma agri]|uniref:HTH LytTR-type domain-containing protein n=1 Tax=Spirosoma agri TaxID=1987381 RepID=A0A6M0IIF5_9BACT|nr:LytTR family transcriptional regulator DNA-binding domain-containing protein [Spirosoma agri]NEU68018.1 hypothetical protein [Spirosoma agri]